MLASRHGWDGVFPFCYDDGNVPDSEAMFGYFCMRNNTVQLAHQIACNNLLTRDYNKNADKEAIVAPLSETKELELFRKNHHTYSFGFNGLELDVKQALLAPTAIDVSGNKPHPLVEPISEDTEEIVFTGDHGDSLRYDMTIPARHWLSASQGKTNIFTGFISQEKHYPFGNYFLGFGETNLEWATVTMTEVKQDDEGTHYLLAITGEMRNTEQEYQKILNNKITLNNSGIDTFGKAPILCECLSVDLYIKDKVEVVYYPLDETGDRIVEKYSVTHDDFKMLYFHSADKTIWYEIVIKP